MAPQTKPATATSVVHGTHRLDEEENERQYKLFLQDTNNSQA